MYFKILIYGVGHLVDQVGVQSSLKQVLTPYDIFKFSNVHSLVNSHIHM